MIPENWPGTTPVNWLSWTTKPRMPRLLFMLTPVGKLR
jgi:hypothetical protein